jgi:hypothetical protein
MDSTGTPTPDPSPQPDAWWNRRSSAGFAAALLAGASASLLAQRVANKHSLASRAVFVLAAARLGYSLAVDSIPVPALVAGVTLSALSVIHIVAGHVTTSAKPSICP